MSACQPGFARHVTSHAWLTADAAREAATGRGHRCNGSIWRGCCGQEGCPIWYLTGNPSFNREPLGGHLDNYRMLIAAWVMRARLSAVLVSWSSVWGVSKMSSALPREQMVDFQCRHFLKASVLKLGPRGAARLPGFSELAGRRLFHLGSHLAQWRTGNPAGSRPSRTRFRHPCHEVSGSN